MHSYPVQLLCDMCTHTHTHISVDILVDTHAFVHTHYAVSIRPDAFPSFTHSLSFFQPPRSCCGLLGQKQQVSSAQQNANDASANQNHISVVLIMQPGVPSIFCTPGWVAKNIYYIL